MTIDLALTLLIAMINNAANISDLIAKARAAGKTDISSADLQAIIDGDAVARANLVLAIAAAKAAGK